MNAPVSIRVADYTGEPFAVAVEDAEKVCERIAPLLRGGTPVALSFAGIEVLIGVFASALFRSFGEDCSVGLFEKLLSLRDIGPEDRALVKRTMGNVRAYRANAAAYDVAWAAEMDGEEVAQETTLP